MHAHNFDDVVRINTFYYITSKYDVGCLVNIFVAQNEFSWPDQFPSFSGGCRNEPFSELWNYLG